MGRTILKAAPVCFHNVAVVAGLVAGQAFD